MIKWPVFRIEEIASHHPSSLATGPFGSAVSSRNFRASGIPMLRGSNLSTDVGVRLVEDELVYLAHDKAEDFKRSIARRGDLIFTCWGTVGQVGLIDKNSRYAEYIVSNKQMKLTPDRRIADSEFLYYQLSEPSRVREVQDRSIGSTIPGFNLGQLRAVKVYLPPIAEQKAIAEVLGALDDKIAANTRIAETALSLAHALYHSSVADQSERVELRELIGFEYGRSLPASTRTAGEVRVVGSGGVTGMHDTALVDRAGIVVGRKGSMGTVHWIDGPHYPIDTTFYVVNRSPYPDEFLYFALEVAGFSGMNSDSAVPGLNRDAALSETTRIPSLDGLRSFQESVPSLFILRATLARESQTLAELRDTLLPALMDGTIRVKDAIATTEEVL